MSASKAEVVGALRSAVKERDRLLRENNRLLAGATEPIAIVGMACRYPGEVASPEGLWELVAEGRDAIAEFPTDRGWDLDRLYDPDIEAGAERLTTYTRRGGFLYDSAEFDAEFFGISPREALTTDPQQRLLLEACWETLEDAGVDPASLRGSQTGVFTGVMYQDYGEAPGMAASVVSGRVAYTLGLEGPTMTVDTACSSSLVAMHLAAQALRSGECSLALAGGVTVLSTPGMLIHFSRQRGLSPDGRSKSFAEAADGAGWSEGVGVLALERLSDAERNGRRILAVLKGSAVNQDGASNGLTAPNGPSQERVIRQALANARLEPQDVDAVEAHGTGTTLGDPIEAGALLATYGRERDEPLRLGSIKSNIGHTQAAAGVAGVIKMVQAMRHGVLPRTLHVDRPSSKVDWEAGEIELLTEPREWQPNGKPRRAGVSSFGASGTNAHVILEQGPEHADAGVVAPAAGDSAAAKGLPHPLVLSAKSEPALREAAKRLAGRLDENPDLDPTDVAWSLASTRAHFSHRAAALGGDRQALLDRLSTLAAGGEAQGIVRGFAGADRAPIFLFPGQGAQSAQMAVELLDSSPAFAAHVAACEEALEPHVQWSLGEVLRDPEGAWLDRLDIVQPALFAVMVSLAKLWRECGVEPAAVVGHSQGEIAAAHIAGGLSLEDAALVIAERGKAMARIAGKGGMLSVSLSPEQLAPRLEPYGERVSLAAINGPASLVVSGEPEALSELLEGCEGDDVRAQRIAVDYAAHSAQIEALEGELLEAFASISPRSGDIPLHSTVTGELLDTAEQDGAYWYRNLRQTVRLEPVLRSLLEQGRRVFVEVGPHPVLGFGVNETIEAALDDPGEATVLGTLRRDEGSAERFALSLAAAHTAGAKLDWEAFFAGTGAKRVPLPTYPFQRERYWLSQGSGPTDASSIGQREVEHPFLAAAIEDPDGERLTLTGRISLSTHPWLADHAVLGTVILPGTAFLELALRAGEEAGAETVEELTLLAPLVIPEQGAVALQVAVGTADDQGGRPISIHSRAEDGGEAGEWAINATGTLGAAAPAPPEPPESWPPAGAESLPVADLYDRLAERGFDYGPAFQGLTAAWRDGEEIYAEVELAEAQREEATRYTIHPALLDATLHGALLAGLHSEEQGSARMPFSWSGVSVLAAGPEALRVRLQGGEEQVAIDLCDAEGIPLAKIGSLRTRPVSPEQMRSARATGQELFELNWVKTPLPEASKLETTLLDTRTWELDADPIEASHAIAAKGLEAIQAHLAGEEAAERLVFLTEGALSATPEEDPSLPAATLAGLLRSAASEHPGGFGLIDTDGSEASSDALQGAIAASALEPQIALRDGEALVARLTEAKGDAGEAEGSPAFDPDKTILITGATGGLGALFAHHLAEAHGARHLLLASRSGEEAPGATELREELEALGAKATIVACDVSDRDQLTELLDSIPEANPLGAVIHAAGAFDNGLIPDLDPARLSKVMTPKADAAHHLHELSAGSELSHFVLFSSAAGLLGGPGQGNYAAANAFLDALAAKRRAAGLPATSLAWGLWEQKSNLVGEMNEAQIDQVLRHTRMLLGFAAIPVKQGLELFEQTIHRTDPLLAPISFDRAALRSQAKAGSLPALMRGLVRMPKSRERSTGSLAVRLAGVAEAEREAFVLDFVRRHVATVLGHDAAGGVDPERAFKDLGFDSLAAVELRNRLVGATGISLEATVVFDYPTAAALARYLLEEVSASGDTRRAVVRAQASDEPIAIVGMACRYPGEVASPEGLWELVAEGADGITEFPADRGWDVERLYDPDPEAVGKRMTSYTREGGFLRDPAEFDAEFFGISPREALAADPQQRVLLEACWEALESTGVDPGSLRGSQAGVFAGVSSQDHMLNLRSPGVDLEGYGLTGGSASVLSGRVAYTLGLEGPAMTIDTACSSSLVAMHLAAQALRSGECSLALAGGVTVLSTPGVFVEFSRQRGLAPDGRCKSFADGADGTGFAEGVGVLALERLSDAERNGRRILAVLKGSAVNQDGASNGLTAPNGPSQERVIRQALANARLEPKDVDVVEAHGTGTTLGDPIEAGALLATYGQDREEPLRLGAIKSNIGHTQAAAGVAGVIKMTMAMREGVLPRTLHVDRPSSNVDWEAGKVELLTEPREWQPNGKPRRAGVSSFGISGTNAHVIIEEAPEPTAVGDTEESQAPRAPLPGAIALPLSAKTEPALREAASNLATHLQDNPDLDPTDIAFSLARTRALFDQRAAITGSDREQLLAGLAALSDGEPATNVFEAKAAPGKLAYLLTGQGAQRAGMGKELHESSPVFAKALDEACEALDQHLSRPLKELLFAKEGSKKAELLDDTTFTQPALFAIEVALFRTLEALGMKPDYLTGHSVGEIAAAHICGVLSLPDAARLITARASLMGELPKGGAMVAIEATEAEVTEALEGKEAELSIAAINGPTSIVISGQEKQALEVQSHFEAQGKRTKRLTVSHAFHSPLIEPMLEDFAEVAKTLDYHEPKIPIVSNLTGEILTAEQAQDPSYWVSHARAAVRFAKGIETLDAQGVGTYLELGPDAVLTAMAASCLPEGSEAALIPTLRSGKEEGGALLGALAQAHASGTKVAFERLHPNAKRVPLPTYPFQRERFWLTGGAGANDLGAAGLGDAEHPLLAAAIELPGEDGWLLTGRISLSTHPWLADHAVLGTVILPGTAFLELALKAGEEVGCETVEELTLQAPLVLAEQSAVSLQVSVGPSDERGSRPVSIHSRTEAEGEPGEWVLHASGSLSAEAPTAPEPLTTWPPEGAEPLPTEDLYERLAEVGFDYGPAFQGLTAAWRAGEEIYAEVELPEDQREVASRFAIHPALLDSALHATMLAALHAEEQGSAGLPFSWSGVSVLAGGPEALRVRLQGGEEQVAIDLCDGEGSPLAKVGSLRARPVSPEQMRSARAANQGLLELDWQQLTLPDSEDQGTTLLDTRTWELDADPIEASHAIAAKGLEAIQAHLAGEEAAERLVFLTEGALSATPEEDPSLPAATLAGLLRSAASEHPGGFGLIDTDGSEASSDALQGAIAASALEPQIALRDGEALVARLTEAKGDAGEAEGSPAFDPEKTILITGATGGLGALFARHLAETHGARHLILASRSGEKAKGAKELQAELEELGAKATIVACDVSDRDQLTELLDSIPEANPLGAVIHAAGVIDDATIEAMDQAQVDRVLAPKADAAHHLHELSAELGLSAFVLFSSIAGFLGIPGQGNYAAANSFLDALAAKRRREGLAATSIAWGMWERESGMTAGLGEADMARMRRSAIAPIADEQGLQLFNAAIGTAASQAVAMTLNRSGLRSQAAAGTLPPLFGGLIRGAGRRKAVSGQLAAKLATVPEAEREAFVLEAVRAEVAAVLGHDSAASIDPERSFKDLGFDSLAAVELRNRLVAATGVQLAATMAFDYPSAAALAHYLLAEVDAGGVAHKIAVKAQASDEPIAIVGMACRYPGGVSSPESLWELVAKGADGITEFPADRGWDVERLYDPDIEAGGKRMTSYTREGGFLHDSGDFDAEFFGISPREALGTDPQQRLLLETSWQALEDAGIDPGGLSQTQTGVFAGVMYQDYGEAAGMTQSIVSGRVAYTLGLEGPAITVDTACSSSLVAMHLAAQALRSGECTLALAGGVTVLSTPGVFVEFSRQRGLAPDGRSKSFAEAADGVGWAEGVGVLALERLSDAKRNGHEVLATIKGSAVNQDGASNGLTAPNGPSQERVIRQALANARLEPKDVDAVEAHGTGTTLGDPIEAGALLATYGQDREEPLRLGSLKSNIGHTQAAAGVAGVIKMTMAMREGVLPKTLHVDQPSSNVDWEAGKVELLTDQLEWQPNGAPRRAGVSSFGISGTNAHVILEEAPEVEEQEQAEERTPLPAIPLALSAKSPEALREQAKRLAVHLKESKQDPTDVAFSLATTRTSFGERAVAVGADAKELTETLSALAKGESAPNLITDKAAPAQDPVFLFPGQGSQWQGMALELYRESQAFKRHIDACGQALSDHVDWSLVKDVLEAKDESWMERLDMVQPALFALMVSLARLWEENGVKPTAVAGHSQGEIAAAHIAGALSLEDAALIVARRSQAMRKIAGEGGMLSVSLPAKELEPMLEPYGGRISIAAINGPASLIVSGEPEALQDLAERCEKDDIRAQEIAVDYAAHSAQIDALEDELEEAFAPVEQREADIPFHSTVTGEPIETTTLDSSYWFRNLRETVLIEPVLRSLIEAGKRVFIEIGPHPVLGFGASETAEALGAQDTAILHTLRREEGDMRRFTLSLAAAHAAGAKLDWQAFFKGTGARRVPLPTYPFQRKRYWLESRASAGDLSAAGLSDIEHPLLGASIPSPEDDGLALSGAISLATHPWLADHAVAGTVLLPGTAFLECALYAGGRCGAEQVKALTIEAPLAIPEQGAIALRVSVSEPLEAEREISIHSQPGGDPDAPWTRHASGTLSQEQAQIRDALDAWPPEGAEPIELAGFYERIAEIGFEYGSAFQGLTNVFKQGDHLYAEVSLAPEQRSDAGRFAIHPALSDSALHAGILAALGEEDGEDAALRLPFNWQGVSVEATGARAMRVRLSARPEGELSLLFADETGSPIAQVAALGTREISKEQLAAARPAGQSDLLAIAWQTATLSRAEEPGETVLHELELPEGTDPAAVALKASEETLAHLQSWLAGEHAPGERLALLTKGAVATNRDESPDPAAASIWGLVRSAQSEHPGSFLLIDTDGSEASQAALDDALESEEPQVALREGQALVPRAKRLPGPEDAELPIDPERTVLITGGLSGLGALFAIHLARDHGARHLLLVSRSGEKAAGAKGLVAELEELGAEPTLAACDVSDSGQLRELLAEIPEARPLGAVIHSAGVLADSTIAQMKAEQLAPVFAPKVDAAWHLHELTRDGELDAFVLFSSAAGTLGGSGQGNYAAANCFLDALAQKREVEGLPATSIAWGLWEQEDGMTSELSEADLARMRRGGIESIAEEQGTELFDAALRSGEPALAALPLNASRLRSTAGAGTLPPLLTSLVRVPASRRTPKGSLAHKLASLSTEEGEKAVLELVTSEIAAVLGHDSGAQIDPECAFKEMGFDSLAAVELRNRLVAATGLALQPTLVFDYPSPAQVAAHLTEEATASGAGAKVALAAQASDEPIAIVGMACRYPGEVSSPESLWELVAKGTDGITEFPADRGWDLERLYDPDIEAGAERLTSYTREGGFLHDSGEFDAEFFGISPREALVTDPQQRLLLETSWQALEDAGIDPGGLSQTQTGVFAGVMYQDYGEVPGMSQSLVSGRVAYTLGLEGPAITVDTACSASLVAVHLATQALRSGECSLALAGGVTVLSTPGVFVEFSRQRGLAPDGCSKSFAEAADGAGFAEGVGVLALERLSDAKRNGHEILATIKGSAVNQDGASNGLTAPNGPSQERVIRQALANARLEPKDVDAVEAHGTGTTLGDPIEAGALLATYGQDREEPLKLGSIKSNIGHTQAAAGVAGVIKMVQAMRHGVLPKTLHVDQPSSKVDWEAGEIELLTEPIEWQPNGKPRRAGVSSFGISGTNAHVIIEEAPESAAVGDTEDSQAPRAPLPGADCPAPLGQGRARPARDGGQPRDPPPGQPRPRPQRRGLLPDHHQGALRATGSGHGLRSRSAARRSCRTEPRRGCPQPLRGQGKARKARLPAHRPGSPESRHGQRAPRGIPRLRQSAR